MYLYDILDRQGCGQHLFVSAGHGRRQALLTDYIVYSIVCPPQDGSRTMKRMKKPSTFSYNPRCTVTRSAPKTVCCLSSIVSNPVSDTGRIHFRIVYFSQKPESAPGASL